MKILIPIGGISVNKCWQGRRFRTPLYLKWQEAVALSLNKEDCQKFQTKEALEVSLVFYVKYPKKIDTDNLIKSSLDALTQNKIILDDRYIYKITAEKKQSDKEGIRVEIMPCG